MTERKRIKTKIEKLVKEYVKKRDNYICQKCGRKVDKTNCHASHVIPVSADGRMAFEPLNLKVLCFHCHINWWHKNPTESGVWFKEKFPQRFERLEEIRAENRLKGKIHISEYNERLEELICLIEKL
jgi:5-methylcytosine-specific restriction endonuclease McrA